MTDPDADLLRFPTDYPIKVVGRADPALRGRIDAVVLRHVPDLAQERVSERVSGAGNFVSITYVVVARSREQVIALVEELASSEGVVMVI
ncbi:MAG: DUF493 domain-containing protein [Steroidobacteraceae bacterium]